MRGNPLTLHRSYLSMSKLACCTATSIDHCYRSILTFTFGYSRLPSDSWHTWDGVAH
jgi:hypothetical protein